MSGASVWPKSWAQLMTVRPLVWRKGMAFVLALSRLITVAKSFGPPCVNRTLPPSAALNAGHFHWIAGIDTSDHWFMSLNHAPDSLMVAAKMCGYLADSRLVKTAP